MAISGRFAFEEQRRRKREASGFARRPSWCSQRGSVFWNRAEFSVLFSSRRRRCFSEKTENCVAENERELSLLWLVRTERKMLLFQRAKRSPRRRRLDPVFVFAKDFGLIEGGQPVFFRAAARKKGSKRGRRTLFGGEVLYNVSSLAGL